ncbi:hypothetical protein GCM10010172_73040 [Paractinoplanes ferrugineus]|uniref:Pentapeptide repeat-containing protein n=1 Tax=Paractinoplanes ferrugineus TaxID=113564 RepID=A0A919J6L1_9ACTN|nr:pentapeptide repeat-containing protein [Actinoplanes ferrugineus]GIE11541.1 hypothetical protein Afe05nite_33810 [Actinoplanes ferrugineus]
MIGALGAFFLVVAGWLVIVVPPQVIAPCSDARLAGVTDRAKNLELRDSRIKMPNDLRAGLLQLAGGIALAAGLVLTYRQLRMNRDGQITERFTAAISHLGQDEDNLSVTLGGIYALERIARDSHSDRSAIQEILAAYVRARAPSPPRNGLPGPDTPRADMPRMAARLPAVQAALPVLGRMPRPADVGNRLDLRRTDLRRVDLRGANLRFADLEEADLRFAVLGGADLRDLVVCGTDFTDARLNDVRICDFKGGDTATWPAGFDPATGTCTTS